MLSNLYYWHQAHYVQSKNVVEKNIASNFSLPVIGFQGLVGVGGCLLEYHDVVGLTGLSEGTFGG
jgi:hypothetical protein